MSTDTLPKKTPDEAQLDASPVELLLRVYRFFHNKRVGLFLILAMGMLTLLGVLFQQAPDGVRDNPQSWQSFLDAVRPRYRGWTAPLAFLGVFTMFESWPFRIVTGLLATSILACTVHRVPLLWRQARTPHTHVKESFFDHGRVHRSVTTSLSPTEARDQLAGALGSQRFRVLEGDGAGTNLYADRFRYAPFGTAVAHLAFIVILAGVLISSLFGFKDDEFTVTVGSTVPVGHGTNLSVAANSFTDSYYDDGRPKDYVSDLVLYDGDQKVKQQQVRVNTPLRYQGVSINQSYFGIAAQIKITDASGTVLHQVGVPLQYQTDDGVNAYGKVRLPEQNLLVYVVTAASGQMDPQIGPGQARIEVYQGDANQPLASQVVSQGTPTKLGDLTYTFERERQFTGLMVSKDPGKPWIWVGASLLLLGTCVTMFLRHHRLWVRIHPAPGGAQVRVASPDRTDLSFQHGIDGVLAKLPQTTETTTTTKESAHARHR